MFIYAASYVTSLTRHTCIRFFTLVNPSLQPFEQRAAAEREAWRVAVAAAPAAAPSNSSSHADAADDADTATILPISKVKRIAKLDDECGNIGKDAAYVLTVATEVFIELLAEEAAQVAMVRATAAYSAWVLDSTGYLYIINSQSLYCWSVVTAFFCIHRRCDH